MKGIWSSAQNTNARNYVCGHKNCGREIGSEKGWYFNNSETNIVVAWIFICPACQKPTFFYKEDQIPGNAIGQKINYLPQDIDQLYDEIRKCTSQNSYTASVLACRKLLMHIAVERGARENLPFTDYVSYLADNHYAPPGSAAWVDRIRMKGNEANHEIKIMGKNDALELIGFVEMLLKFIYEFPGSVGIVPAATN